MPSLDSLRHLAHHVRRIPGDFGLRPYTVTLVQGAFSGTFTGEGTETKTSTLVTEGGGHPPKVRFLNPEQQSINDLPSGTVVIGPITPAHIGGGTAVELLLGDALARGDQLHVKLVGPFGTQNYAIREIPTDRAIHFTLTAIPVSKE